MNTIFRFKQFNVDQKGCAMKINTDGVLLGAFAKHPNPEFILDIGTGTGVISLMLAQQYINANIEAIEIDSIATQTAEKNFKNSKFSHQLNAICVSIDQYTNHQKFDLIVSNPPFFINDFKSTEQKKQLARHADEYFFDNLILKVASLLAPEGLFWVILPPKQSELLAQKANKLNLYVEQQIHLHSSIDKPEFRRITCLGKINKPIYSEKFYIYEKQNKHTENYKTLLKPFFINY